MRRRRYFDYSHLFEKMGTYLHYFLVFSFIISSFFFRSSYSNSFLTPPPKTSYTVDALLNKHSAARLISLFFILPTREISDKNRFFRLMTWKISSLSHLTASPFFKWNSLIDLTVYCTLWQGQSHLFFWGGGMGQSGPRKIGKSFNVQKQR